MEDYLYIKEWQVPLYRGELIVVVTNSNEKLNQHLDFGNDEIYGHALELDWKGTSGYMMILNFNNHKRSMTYGVVTHESIHLAMYIAQSVGIKLDYSNQEPITYLAEWISDTTSSFCKSLGFNF